MVKRVKKREALTVSRLIYEVLVGQLSIPLRQVVNDTSFQLFFQLLFCQSLVFRHEAGINTLS